MTFGGTLRRARFRSRLLRYPVVRLRHRGLRPSDAFLVSYPRSGTTWLRFLLSHVLTGTPTAFDPAEQTVPYVGAHAKAPGLLPGNGRLIFSHETIPVGDRRVIYVIRDPRAVALSEYRWLERRDLASKDLDRFVAAFTRGRSNPWGSWGGHVSTWLESGLAKRGRLHLVRFEDLKEHTVDVLGDAVRFLDVDVNRALIDEAVQDNTFERMRQKEEAAPDQAFAKGVRRELPFVRAGDAGGWREVLTAEHTAAIRQSFGGIARRVGYTTVSDLSA